MGYCQKCGRVIKDMYKLCYECLMLSKTHKDGNGYLRFNDSDELVHRWVAEKKLGRKLNPGEVVHHRDRNKLNNSPSNLWIFRNQDEHDEVHEIDRAIDEWTDEDFDYEDDYEDDFEDFDEDDEENY